MRYVLLVLRRVEQDRTDLLVSDSRHEPQKIDLEFLDWLDEVERPFALVFTKTDKLKPSHVKKNTDSFLQALMAFHSATPEVFLTSSKTRDGKREILGFIGGLFDSSR